MQLAARYAAVVDDPARLDEWPNFFADEASYVVTTKRDLAEGGRVAIMMDDTKGKILDRPFIINDIWAGHYDPQATTHTVSIPVIEEVGDGSLRCRTGFTVDIVKEAGNTYRLAGEYVDEIVGPPEQLRFRSKLVVLSNDVLPTYFVRPL
ncbi:MAG: aromatic-ring-hydroxylating dioxygenase subunit beta [Acidimicrobiia bacterium]